MAILTLLGVGVAQPGLAQSTANAAPEADLIAAMRLENKDGDRSLSSGEAIRAYIRLGLVAQRPEKRLDYTDYRIIWKPASLLGYPLIVVEEEYPSKYIGCCVSPGIGAVVKVVGDTKRLQQFAGRNGCSVSEGEDAEEPLKMLKIQLAGSTYARISCRERDARN